MGLCLYDLGWYGLMLPSISLPVVLVGLGAAAFAVRRHPSSPASVGFLLVNSVAATVALAITFSTPGFNHDRTPEFWHWMVAWSLPILIVLLRIAWLVRGRARPAAYLGALLCTLYVFSYAFPRDTNRALAAMYFEGILEVPVDSTRVTTTNGSDVTSWFSLARVGTLRGVVRAGTYQVDQVCYTEAASRTVVQLHPGERLALPVRCGTVPRCDQLNDPPTLTVYGRVIAGSFAQGCGAGQSSGFAVPSGWGLDISIACGGLESQDQPAITFTTVDADSGKVLGSFSRRNEPGSGGAGSPIDGLSSLTSSTSTAPAGRFYVKVKLVDPSTAQCQWAFWADTKISNA
jgi:hypothetical protein